MRCLLTRIIINMTEVFGRSLPKFASDHISNCPECRMYMELGKKLSTTAPVSNIPEYLIQNLNNKIISKLSNPEKKIEPKFFGNIFSRIPITVAIFILIITTGIIIMNINRKNPTLSEKAPVFSMKNKNNIINLNKLLTRVESPIIEEADNLKKSLNSAGTYLRSVIDFGLPGIPD